LTTVKLNARILVKNQQSAVENGVYVVSSLSDASNDNFAVLTRASDYDNSIAGSVHSGDFVFVTEGTINNSHGFVLISEGSGTDGNTVINTDNLVFTQFSGTGQIVEGSGISINGNEIAVDTRLANLNSLTVSGGTSALNVLVGSSDVEKINISSEVVTLLSNSTLQGLQDQLQVTSLSGLVVNTVQVDVSSLRTDLNALSSSASDVSVTTALRSDVNTLSGLVVNTVQVDVSTLRSNVDTLSGLVVNTVQVDVSALRTDVNAISGGLGSMSSQDSDSVTITGGFVGGVSLSAITITDATFTNFVLDLGEI
jgi:pyrimidine operon attenuation protein/uracil phosphoribosyltransferase